MNSEIAVVNAGVAEHEKTREILRLQKDPTIGSLSFDERLALLVDIEHDRAMLKQPAPVRGLA